MKYFSFDGSNNGAGSEPSVSLEKNMEYGDDESKNQRVVG